MSIFGESDDQDRPDPDFDAAEHASIEAQEARHDAGDWHQYVVDIRPDRVDWYVDGDLVHTSTGPCTFWNSRIAPEPLREPA